MDHPSYRSRSGNGAQFVSSKCPPGPGLEKSCELPFGYVWTPMAPCTEKAVVDSEGKALFPVLCLNCLSYVNKYSTFDFEACLWKCSICGTNNVAPKEVFSGPLHGVFESPTIEFRQPIRPSNKSENCNSLTYVVVLDSHIEPDEARAMGVALESMILAAVNEGANLNLGLVVFDEVVSIYQLGGLLGIASADIYSPLQTETDEYSVIRKDHIIRRSYLVEINQKDDLSYLWQCLAAVYGISSSTTKNTSEHSLRGTKKPLTRLERLRQKKEERLIRNSENNSIEANTQTSAWSRKASVQRPTRCTGEAIQIAIDLATCGAIKNSSASRVLLFTNGCPNFGVGSVVAKGTGTDAEVTNLNMADVLDSQRLVTASQFFDQFSKYASENGVSIDVFCTGGAELGLPAYQALVEPTGGYVLPHESFKTDHLIYNLDFLLKQTYVSTAVEDNEDETVAVILNDQSRLFNGCIIDFHMSSFVSPTHVVGSGELLEKESKGLLPNERSAFSIGASLSAGKGFTTNNLPNREIIEDTCLRLKMGRFDPLATLSVILEVNDTFTDQEFAYFQCIARYVDRDGQYLVTKVHTHRLPVANAVADYLDAIDDEVVSFVLGREAVYRSVYGRENDGDADFLLPDGQEALDQLAFEAKTDLDATIQRISGSFRLLGLGGALHSVQDIESENKKPASSLDFAFPPELATALNRLFFLRRGSLLSDGPIRSDTKSFFLRLPMEDCLCQMAPTLWSTGVVNSESNLTQLKSVPSGTLSLWDNCIIAADHHDQLFVWSGRLTLSSEFDHIREHCKTFLLERSKNRFPMPLMHIVSEGDSMSRRFTARLASTHLDPPEHQMAHFPELASLSPLQLTNIRGKFPFHSETSYSSFRKWFWEVASAASASKDEGISLCD